MFERFTDRARRVVVIAQEEAHRLRHDVIGTEHILLGLISEGEGVSAVVLKRLDVEAVDIRRYIEETIGVGTVEPVGHIPFTQRAKKTFELALREALQLGHNYIGCEHLLLALIREGEGVACQALVSKCGLELGVVRKTVIQVLSEYTKNAEQRAGESIASFRTDRGFVEEVESEPSPLTPSDVAAMLDAMSPRERKATIAYLRAWFDE